MPIPMQFHSIQLMVDLKYIGQSIGRSFDRSLKFQIERHDISITIDLEIVTICNLIENK